MSSSSSYSVASRYSTSSPGVTRRTVPPLAEDDRGRLLQKYGDLTARTPSRIVEVAGILQSHWNLAATSPLHRSARDPADEYVTRRE